jgi:anti-sigma factor RsiW
MLASDRLHELIQGDLDGVLSAADRAELARLLLQDPEARRLHGQMQRADRLLHDIPAAEPPAGLRDAVLGGPARPAESTGRWSRLSTYRIAAAFLGGFLVIGVAYLVSDGRMPGAELQGSVSTGAEPASPAAQSRVSLQSEGLVVDASLRRDVDRLRLELKASATAPGEVVVRFDAAATTFTGSVGDASVVSASGAVTVPLAAGRHVTALEFSGVAPIQLELRARGQIAGAANLSVSEP